MKLSLLTKLTGVLLLALSASCATKSSSDATNGQNIQNSAASGEAAAEEFVEIPSEYVDLVNAVYDRFVFATDSTGDANPEDYFTTAALQKLQDDYEFDCEDEPCYAYYILRSAKQDSKPGTDGRSKVCDVTPTVDGWYVVSYYDMGWAGMTRFKFADGKIDDYQQVNPD